MEVDFDALNCAINETAECRVEGCSCRVPEPDVVCMGCFLGVASGEVTWDPDLRCLRKEDG